MAYSLETSSVKTIVPGDTVSGFCDVVARQKINEVSGEVPQLSAGEGIDISTVNGKTVITNNISAGENISLVYDMETNTYRIDGQGGEGHTYTGVAPIQVNNTTDEISITGESLSAGPGIDLFSSGGYVVVSSTGKELSAGPGIDLFESGGYFVISAIPSNTCCVHFTDTLTSVDLSSYLNYDKVTIVHSNDGAADCNLYWDGKTKVFPSGLYCEMVKGEDVQNNIKWSFANSGWINDNWWDWD